MAETNACASCERLRAENDKLFEACREAVNRLVNLPHSCVDATRDVTLSNVRYAMALVQRRKRCDKLIETVALWLEDDAISEVEAEAEWDALEARIKENRPSYRKRFAPEEPPNDGPN